MASDLATTPTSGLRVQLCGDAHLSNFGVFASPERRLVFDINDFDETLPGPFEWDVKRLAASFEVAGRDNGFTDAERRDGRPACVGGLPQGDGRLRRHDEPRRLVRAARHRRRRSPMRQLGRSGADASAGQADRARRSPRPARATACRRSTSSPQVVDGEPRIISDPPLIVPDRRSSSPSSRPTQFYRRAARSLLRSTGARCRPTAAHLLEQYRFVDLARKVVGRRQRRAPALGSC